MSFKVTVIMPVYNAEKFISKAIESAIKQKEVGEVVIVDDGSTDKSLNICKDYALTDSRIKVFQHPDCKNHGRSATRNLAINKASCDFIAFLDADDFFLDNRFTKDKEIFENDKTVDGIYNAIGAHFYRVASKEELDRFSLTTIKALIEPDKLFLILLQGKFGYFSGDGLTVKKSVFDKIGLFDEELYVSEDTLLWFKMAAKCKLVPGIIDIPVSMRGMHHDNVCVKEEVYEKPWIILYTKLLKWILKNGSGNEEFFLIYDICLSNNLKTSNSLLKRSIVKFKLWLFVFFNRFDLIRSKSFIYRFPLYPIFRRAVFWKNRRMVKSQ